MTDFKQTLLRDFPDLYTDQSHIVMFKGWHDIVHELSKKIRNTSLNIQIQQLKPKFGSLRLYYKRPLQPVVEKLINQACEQCRETCAECGQKGSVIVNNNWIFVLCPEHATDLPQENTDQFIL